MAPQLPVGTTITISGTSSDAGGVVAGIEISVDGGTTWNIATVDNQLDILLDNTCNTRYRKRQGTWI